MALPPTSRLSAGLPRRTLLGAGFATALAGLAACGDQQISAQAKLPSGPDLVVGVCLELTGANAVVGNSAQRGVQVALDEINANGLRVGGKNRKIKVVVRDTKSDPDTATKVIEELIGEQVTAVIGGAVAATSAAMSPIAEKQQVPMISLAAADNIVKPVPKHRFVFKLGPDASNVAELIATQLEAQHSMNIAVLAEDSPHGDAGLAALTDAARVHNITISGHARLPLTTADYRSQADQVVTSKVKAVVVWSQAPVALAAATALRQVGFVGGLFFDTGAAADDAVDKKNQQVMAGAQFVAPEIMSADSQVANSATNYARQVFFNDFNRRFGPMTSYALFGADALRMIGTAAERTTDPTRLRLRNGLESAPFYLLGGSYTFSTINHGGVEPDQLAVLRLDPAGWRRT
jgi:branched-chain amino acid transport system substrate-binding protein